MQRIIGVGDQRIPIDPRCIVAHARPLGFVK